MQSALIDRDDVRGFFHAPRGNAKGALVLTHGAGGNRDAPLLVALAGAFAEAGVAVLRCDLPFRRMRPRGPPSPNGAATDRAGLRKAVELLRELALGPFYLGGHSYGGRQASILAAEQPGLVERLLLLSYPLHPPTQPERLRTAHFPRLGAPAVFVHGTADPFGTVAELKKALGLLPISPKLLTIEGAGHDLKRGRLPLDPIVAALID